MTDKISAICATLNIPFVTDLSSYRFIVESLQLIPYNIAKEKRVVVLDDDGENFIIALEDPFAFEVIEEVRCLLQRKVTEICAPPEAIDGAIAKCYHQKENVASTLIATLQEHTEESLQEIEGYDLLGSTADSPVIRLLNVVITEAIQQGVSDIHFELSELGMKIRYRIDGVLQMRHAPPKEFHLPLVTRIKILAGLDIAEQRLPQDGRIKLQIGEREIDFRVSTLPTVYGERAVLRILDRENIFLGLNRLGMPPDILEKFSKLIRLSEGIILVTGPTGSGKTTTLYSAIQEINSDQINVMTIEDPVEYKLPNMAQIGVNPKIDLTFAKGLRHILRQDPDIIMIGEIRDKETAEIAIQAALTGHLVFSTLHTNDAPSAITRLIDMGIEPYLLSSTIVGVLAQRLLRVICPHCKEEYLPTELEEKDLGVSLQFLYKSRGCNRCFGFGYKGRVGIYELMTMHSDIKQQMMKSGDAILLKTIAQKHGMVQLRLHGAALAARGVTTAHEVLRVTSRLEE